MKKIGLCLILVLVMTVISNSQQTDSCQNDCIRIGNRMINGCISYCGQFEPDNPNCVNTCFQDGVTFICQCQSSNCGYIDPGCLLILNE